MEKRDNEKEPYLVTLLGEKLWTCIYFVSVNILKIRVSVVYGYKLKLLFIFAKIDTERKKKVKLTF